MSYDRILTRKEIMARTGLSSWATSQFLSKYGVRCGKRQHVISEEKLSSLITIGCVEEYRTKSIKK